MLLLLFRVRDMPKSSVSCKPLPSTHFKGNIENEGGNVRQRELSCHLPVVPNIFMRKLRKLQCCNVLTDHLFPSDAYVCRKPSLFKKGTEFALHAGMSTVGGEPVLLHKLRLIPRGLVSKDFRGPYVETRTSDTQKPPARQSRGSPRWNRIIVLTLAVSVIHTSLAENNKTSEASELTCASSEPRFIVKVAIVVLMLGLFYWANRIFDKLDEASYARLSRALSRRAHARQRAGWARRR